MPELKKPPEVGGDEFKSAKWDELTRGRRFAPSAAPVLAILCQWYKILDRAVSEMDEANGGQTVYVNDTGDIHAMPQIATIKTASGLITSQFDTAPKLRLEVTIFIASLITSQFDTAPKQCLL